MSKNLNYQFGKDLSSIGFMQGRLSPLVNGKIQAFPWDCWGDEFSVANEYGFKIMEWTLDQYQLYENPLMIEKGRREIINLISKYNVSIPSLTGDCFMQAPFFKPPEDSEEIQYLKNFVFQLSLYHERRLVFSYQ